MLDDQSLDEYERAASRFWDRYGLVAYRALSECVNVRSMAKNECHAKYMAINDQAWSNYRKIEQQALTECLKALGQTLLIILLQHQSER